MALPYSAPAPLNVKGLRIGVLGAARSGVGCARLLAAAGARVVVGDGKPAAEIDAAHAQEIVATGAELRPEAKVLPDLGPLDLLVLSPGVPLDAPLVAEAVGAGVPVTGEVELAYRFSRAPIIAISGTNAKGSTCTLTGAMLNSSGVRTRVCGNIGDPFSGAVAREEPPDVYVLETSSFQLETIEHFRPGVACLLNVQVDHLDRHRSLEAYIAAKGRLFGNQTPDDWAIINADDANAVQAAQGARARQMMYSAHQCDVDARVEGDALVVDLGDGPREVCRQQDLIRAGAPYVQTVLAAASAALIAGATAEGILEGVRSHKLPAEVLELVCEAGGVKFVNSSKATNPAAAQADIESTSGPLVVIAGGLDRGSDFAEFGDLLRRRAKAAYLIGECAQRIADAAAGIPTVLCRTLEEAVEGAYGAAEPGDTILLAPACASWDMFGDYKARGACFREAARRICTSVGKGD